MNEELKNQLESIEKEISEKMSQRRDLLKQAAGERVQNYQLKGPDNRELTLLDLFGDKDELLLIHNMGKGCPYCTLWADGFNGVAEHLADRAAFVLASPNKPEVQKEFAESRGWKFPMVSVADSTLSRDLGFEIEHEGKPWYLPGVSVFTKDEDGTITRNAYDFFGPGDVYAGIWHLFDLLPEGPNGWQPQFSYENEAATA